MECRAYFIRCFSVDAIFNIFFDNKAELLLAGLVGNCCKNFPLYELLINKTCNDLCIYFIQLCVLVLYYNLYTIR
jgi:hypothetical protein